ncbi:hypothetical protein HELRODRAFT_87495 [Helobdella robusta]|uniref:GMP phosphodiesterase delta subunit domain-containing protein n=1 Tax=Helobdella robusta TaxID=6412 RepID=T1G6R0_HELRO|nr:hypothetical protein HELRODRAFT_87495 [Helobdella robusta]ESN94942.1 hypothetical protein HELRODRAFT_87495 [Helobdella robusta]
MSVPVRNSKVSSGNPILRSIAATTADDVASRLQTEEELMCKPFITPEDVLKLSRATDNYLCPLEANIYDIEFVHFKLRDVDSGTTLFEVAKPDNVPAVDSEGDSLDPNAGRFVRYQFNPYFLKLKTVGAIVEFTIGDKPVEKFRMVERHYFKDRLLKCFDFEFGFVIPNSKNTMEHIYELPELSNELFDDMVNSPYETRSDSFYFVDNKLVMHNKADYAYNG